MTDKIVQGDVQERLRGVAKRRTVAMGAWEVGWQG